jgi:nucleoside-diphosphate-sugar epimerase
MRIVVTGASGNVGTALLRRVEADTVTGIARRLPAPGREPWSGADWVRCDLGSAGAPAILRGALAGATAVVHLAWSINPATGDPPMSHTNQRGTEALLTAVADAGVPHLVCASSVAAYRPAARWDEVDERWPCDGVAGSAYSGGKVWLERRLDRFAAEHPDIRVARIRPCAIVQRAAAGQFTRWLLSPLLPAGQLGGRWLPLPFWPGLRAQLVHAEDVADAIARIVATGASGAFNVAAGPALDASALAAAIGGPHLPLPFWLVRAGAGLTWRLGLQPAHPGWLRLADAAPLVRTDRLRTELGWRPSRSAPEAMAELIAGIRDHAGAGSPPLAPADPHERRVRLGVPSHQAQ